MAGRSRPQRHAAVSGRSGRHRREGKEGAQGGTRRRRAPPQGASRWTGWKLQSRPAGADPTECLNTSGMPTRPEPALGESALVGEDGGQQLLQVLVAYSRLRRAKNARQQVLESIVSRHLAGPFASGSGLSPRNRMIEEGTRASLRLGAARHYVRVRRGPGTPRMGDGMGHICGTPNTRPCGMRITHTKADSDL